MSKTFNALWASVTPLPFYAEWSNGTGYLDHAVSGEFAPDLQAGEVITSKGPHGRRIVMIGSVHGNIVLFERYDQPASPIVWNAPTAFQRELEEAFPMSDVGGRLTEEDIALVYEFISGKVLA